MVHLNKSENANLKLEDLTFVSIHVRRTDYAYHLNYWYNLTYVSNDYFQRAKQHYKNQFHVSYHCLPTSGIPNRGAWSS